MKRRTVLGALGTGGLTALAGCSQLDDVLNGSGFNEVKWINLNVLRIHFKEDHDMDGFSIQHVYDDSIEDAVVTQEAPPYSGPRDVRLIRQIKQTNRVYPSRKFKLVGYKGQFGNFISLAQETLGTFEFEIPAHIMPRSNWNQD